MTLWALESADDIAAANVPNAYTFVERASCNEFAVGRDSNRSHAVFNGEGQNFAVAVDVPDANGVVTATGGDVTTVASEVKGVDVLIVAGKSVADGTRLNIPNLEKNQLEHRSNSAEAVDSRLYDLP